MEIGVELQCFPIVTCPEVYVLRRLGGQLDQDLLCPPDPSSLSCWAEQNISSGVAGLTQFMSLMCGANYHPSAAKSLTPKKGKLLAAVQGTDVSNYVNSC